MLRAQTATPVEGEGIWGMLRRHGIQPTAALARQFQDLNADRLKGSSELRMGVRYRLPASEGASPDHGAAPQVEGTRHPIFGSAYELVVQSSDRLAGHVYYVVSGHGGPDPGSSEWLNGKRFTEDEIAYDTALRLARRLLEEGATVYIVVQDPDDGIRDYEYLPMDYDEVHLGGTRIVRDHGDRLRQRVEIINELYDKHRRTAKSQQVVSVHVDSYANGPRQPQIDVHFAYHSENGKRLGRVLRAEMRDQYERHQPGRGYDGSVRHRNLYVLKHTKPVAVLVELGNIRHRGDQVRLVKPGNRQALADWIAEGLIRNASGGRQLAVVTAD